VADPSAEESAHEERKSRGAKENESDGDEREDGFGREGEAGEKEMRAEGKEAAGQGGEEAEDAEFDAKDGAQLTRGGTEGAEQDGIMRALFASVEKDAGHDEKSRGDGEGGEHLDGLAHAAEVSYFFGSRLHGDAMRKSVKETIAGWRPTIGVRLRRLVCGHAFAGSGDKRAIGSWRRGGVEQ
jgi:hypothetical protein